MSLIVVPSTHCMHSTELCGMDEEGADLSKEGSLHFERKGNMAQQGQYGKGSFMARCCLSFIPHAYRRVDAS